ncbi:MAG: hypothetical protein IJH60_01655 [Eubacterium sp.]|nr:hypothetical protein [Eubacterium sp.]
MNNKKKPSIFMQEVKRDINTFRRLKGKERWQFVWDYFRFKIIVALFSLFVIIVFANIIWQGQKPCRLRACVVLNTSDYCDAWFDDFTKKLKADGKPGAVDVNQDQPFDYSNRYYYVQEIEVMTTISSRRMDVAVCGPDMYHYLLALNACMPLDQVLSEDLVNSLKGKGNLVESTANIKQNEDGSPDESEAVRGYFAVDLSGTSFGKLYNENQELEEGEEKAPLYAVIISNTNHLDDSIKLVEALCE